MKNRVIVSFEINPTPASRPRVTRWGTFYGKKYKGFKKDMDELLSDTDKEWLEGLIFADMTFFVGIPKSWSKKKKKLKSGQWCDNNADLDNYEKSILDSLSGVYFHDDRQIVQQQSKKIWADTGSIKIILEEVT
jgi:Holliday junction resolvase RusA-like endonuclease|tara:strand:+ start:2409 stop:2810 length:402 start_codon:yes stop_codon:yes gene_type:complete